MEELRESDSKNFIERWRDFHDAVVQAVTFGLRDWTLTVDLHAQDGREQRGWRAVRLVVDDLVEWSFSKPVQHDDRVIFEAQIRWDDERVLFSLDGRSSSSVEAFCAGSTLAAVASAITYDRSRRHRVPRDSVRTSIDT
jgi:hypothetical protein